jgi:hypothetical protein
VCGAHLHFQIQQTCQSWWCQSIASSFVDFGDPGLGTTMMSNNCPALEPCPPVDGTETIVDERQSCFEQQTSYWWSTATGYDGHHFYTYGIDASDSDTIGTWFLEVTSAGLYRVDAHIPDEASTTAARYYADGGSGRVELAVIDQSADKGWVTLGDLELAEGTDRYIELGDATGESPDLERQVAFDALRFTPLSSEGGGGAVAAGAGGASSTSSAATGGATTSTGGGAGGAPDLADGDAEGGCACRAAGSPVGSRWRWLVGLAALALLRRRDPEHP